MPHSSEMWCVYTDKPINDKEESQKTTGTRRSDTKQVPGFLNESDILPTEAKRDDGGRTETAHRLSETRDTTTKTAHRLY